MGYPMTYKRVLDRNGLSGDYDDSMVAGDLRRLERDTRDAMHLDAYAQHAHVSTPQAKAIFDAFFEEEVYMFQPRPVGGLRWRIACWLDKARLALLYGARR